MNWFNKGIRLCRDNSIGFELTPLFVVPGVIEASKAE